MTHGTHSTPPRGLNSPQIHSQNPPGAPFRSRRGGGGGIPLSSTPCIIEHWTWDNQVSVAYSKFQNVVSGMGLIEGWGDDTTNRLWEGRVINQSRLCMRPRTEVANCVLFVVCRVCDALSQRNVKQFLRTCCTDSVWVCPIDSQQSAWCPVKVAITNVTQT